MKPPVVNASAAAGAAAKATPQRAQTGSPTPRYLWPWQRLLLPLLQATLLASLLGACGRPGPTSPESGTSSDHGHGHTHAAPHGGTLVPLGNERYHLEVLLDSATARLQLYVLDGHAEQFVRIAQPSIEMTLRSGTERHAMTLLPVASRATGETAGDTAHFDAPAGWTLTNAPFDAMIAQLDIRGGLFTNVTFRFP
jgi:hypothetical protein